MFRSSYGKFILINFFFTEVYFAGNEGMNEFLQIWCRHMISNVLLVFASFIFNERMLVYAFHTDFLENMHRKF